MRISAVRSRLVAAITCTLTGYDSVEPTGVTSRCWSTRRSRGWSSSGISPISSRNTIPPSPERNTPREGPTAPVNEPFSWPKSWLSISDAAIALQLMATNGPSARGPCEWSAWAISSLPQPVSPVIRTVDSKRAAWRSVRSSSTAAGASPTSRSQRWAGARSRVAKGEIPPWLWPFE